MSTEAGISSGSCAGDAIFRCIGAPGAVLSNRRVRRGGTMEPDAVPAIDRLLVIWRDPTQDARHLIGILARAHGEIRFWYEQDLSAAFSKGFRLLPEFPEHRVEASPYVERYLFALFAERIPSQARPDARTMLAGWGVERVDDQFEVLARSGGIRATDRIELAEYRSDDDELATPRDHRRSLRAPRRLCASPVRADVRASPRRWRRGRGNGGSPASGPRRCRQVGCPRRSALISSCDQDGPRRSTFRRCGWRSRSWS